SAKGVDFVATPRLKEGYEQIRSPLTFWTIQSIEQTGFPVLNSSVINHQSSIINHPSLLIP
ncbi:MAG: hypothetical protein PHN23_06325, partial [Methanocorpusculum sp.]|nr:hypothetical protein [Methanocorpusculum sp.]